MSIKTRVVRLEAERTTYAEVTLGELILYSFSNVVDPDFERRLVQSTLGRLIAATFSLASGASKGIIGG